MDGRRTQPSVAIRWPTAWRFRVRHRGSARPHRAGRAVADAAVPITSAGHLARAVGTLYRRGTDVVGTVTPEQVPPRAWRFGPLP
ncbi:hypothetical protein [Nocardia sp. NPDC004750]